jgi:hypothetical protein
MLKFLIEAFKASKGRMPNNMEMILLRQKAAKQSIDERKVVSMFDRSAVNPNKPIMGGKNIPETEEEIRQRLLKNNEKGIKSLEERMKKNKEYQDLKKSFEDPEKKANGGRIGLVAGGITNLALRLARGFMKVTGRKPNPDELQKIIREAAEKDLDNAINSAKTPGLMSKDEFAMNVGSGSKAIGRRMNEIDQEKLMKTIDEFNTPNVENKADGGRIGFFKGAQADTKEGKSMSPGTTASGGFRGGNNNDDGPSGPPRVINPPPKDNKPPIQITSDDSVNRGFLSDLRKKNQEKYNRLINTYKPDDFDIMNQIDGTSNLSEEDAKFMERYGVGKIFSDLAKTNIENFFEMKPKGVAPKVKDLKMDVDRPRKYDFAELSQTQLDFLNSPKTQRDLKEGFLEPKQVYDKLPSYEEKTPLNPFKGDQEPTTPEEFNEYLDTIDKNNYLQRLTAADGGRIGYKVGAGKKGVQALLDLVKDKFGKKSITTADKAPTPPKTLERDMFKKADEKFNKTDSDIYEDNLKNLEDLGASKLAERFRLKRKYPGITDDLLDKILIDDNMQRKAEVLATMDEVFRMLEKGKGTDEILDTMKNVTRTKQADGGITRIGLKGGYLASGAKQLGKKYKGSTLSALLENPKLLGAELGHDGIMEIMNLLPSLFADGGRANFVGGGMGRRGFLKMLAGLGGGIAAAKTGILKLAGKEPVKQVAKEVVKSAGSGTPPPYFFKLVEKIKTMGDDTLATQDKAIAKKYKDYTMEEDFAGNIEIIKKGDDVAEDVYMSYKVDEVPVKGKKGSVKVEEYEEFTARPDAEGKMKDIELGVPDEVVNEGSVFEDNMTEFGMTKKAGGGIARMLGE